MEVIGNFPSWKCCCLLPVGMNVKNAKIVGHVSGSRAEYLTQCTLTFKSIYSVRYQYQELNDWRASSASTCTRSNLLTCRANPYFCRIMFEGSWREVKLLTSSLANRLMLFYLVSTLILTLKHLHAYINTCDFCRR
jgi:hypothetical protein